MFTPLKTILDHALHRKPIREGARVAVVLEAAREAIEAAFPERVAAFIKPTAVRNSIITLTVRNPIVSQEIRLRGTVFLAKINERVGTNVVQKIRIRLAPLEVRGGPSVQDGK